MPLLQVGIGTRSGVRRGDGWNQYLMILFFSSPISLICSLSFISQLSFSPPFSFSSPLFLRSHFFSSPLSFCFPLSLISPLSCSSLLYFSSPLSFSSPVSFIVQFSRFDVLVFEVTSYLHYFDGESWARWLLLSEKRLTNKNIFR